HSIPTEMVDRVEVVKGPGSALYGSQATGGIISVFTKNPGQGFNGWASVGYEMKGADEIIDSDADGYGRADFNAGNLRFNGSYGGINTNHIFSLGIRNSKNSYYATDENDKWSNYNLYYKLNHRFSEAFSSCVTAMVHKDTWNNQTARTPNKSIKDVYSFDFFNKWQRETGIFTGRIFLNHSISTNNNLTANTELSDKMYRAGFNTDYTILFPKQNATLIFGIDGIYDHANIDYEKAVMEMSFIGQDSVDIYNSKTSTWSSEWADVYSGVFGSSNQDHIQYNFALYTQYSKTIAKKLNIVLGGRFDLHKEFGSVFNPKIGIAYEVININNFTTNIKVNAATGFRAPPLWGWYSKSLGGYGNSGIVPEKTKNFDIGIFERFGNFGYIELTYFKMNVKNLIINDNLGSTGYGQYVYLPDVDDAASFKLRKNLGDYSPSGFEAGFKIRPHRQLTIMGAYTYTNPEDFTFQTSEHRYNAGVNVYQPIGKNYSIESEFRYNYTGDGYFFDYNGRPYDAFATSNGRISLNAYNNYRISLYGKNLFDTKYKLWHYSWQPGRTILVQFETKF
ncbi:TonB-dependent receptor, partial [bacterium]|nr:TonB-dependent receptor [bacterium]